jgi:hypothetical protein
MTSDISKPIPGQTFPLDALGRKDAFHVPSVLVTSHIPIIPGANLRFTDDEHTQVESCEYHERQAVADPFLKIVQPNTAFWAFVAPELVSDLTHDFQILSEPEDDYDEDYDPCAGCDN